MLISELISHLEILKEKYGDLPVEKEAEDEIEASMILGDAIRLISKTEKEEWDHQIAVVNLLPAF